MSATNTAMRDSLASSTSLASTADAELGYPSSASRATMAPMSSDAVVESWTSGRHPICTSASARAAIQLREDTEARASASVARSSRGTNPTRCSPIRSSGPRQERLRRASELRTQCPKPKPTFRSALESKAIADPAQALLLSVPRQFPPISRHVVLESHCARLRIHPVFGELQLRPLRGFGQ